MYQTNNMLGSRKVLYLSIAFTNFYSTNTVAQACSGCELIELTLQLIDA